jgi:NosR/NirI family transcriptional regulator, nitrous oxide reductase regulator
MSQDLPKTRTARGFVAAGVMGVLAGAWLIGLALQQRSATVDVADVLPAAQRIERHGEVWTAWSGNPERIVGYAAIGNATGYAGPINVLVAVDPKGAITGMKVLDQRESPAFFQTLFARGFYRQFLGRRSDEPFEVGKDVDAVSGATISSNGVAAATVEAMRAISAAAPEIAAAPPRRGVHFGLLDAALIAFFAISAACGRWVKGQWARRLRWVSMIGGLLLLGFVFTSPLTISKVVALLCGYWPSWRTGLSWYLLIGGIVGFILLNGRNPYCSWFCPFGAFQECLGKLAGAKPFRPERLGSVLTWTQRGLALGAVALGLICGGRTR